MSGAAPETPEELNMLAGEYVLCVLDSAEMQAVAGRASDDPRLTQAITGWERRLAPMLTGVEAVAPPDALWARIRQSAALAADASQPAPARPAGTRPQATPAWPRRAAARRVWPWQAATGASLALAAGLATIMLSPATLLPSPATRPDDTPPGGRDVALVAMLTPPESQGTTRSDTAPQMANATGTATLSEPPSDTGEPARPAGRMAGFLAATWPDGTVVLTALAPVPVPGGKALELWLQPPDAKAPKSLGLLAADGRRTTLPAMPEAGTMLSVTLEPAGGSPTGAPTGRLIYAGTLRPLQR
jgi:anti-sigma-K factor RskA